MPFRVEDIPAPDHAHRGRRASSIHGWNAERQSGEEQQSLAKRLWPGTLWLAPEPEDWHHSPPIRSMERPRFGGPSMPRSRRAARPSPSPRSRRGPGFPGIEDITWSACDSIWWDHISRYRVDGSASNETARGA